MFEVKKEITAKRESDLKNQSESEQVINQMSFILKNIEFF